MDPLTVCDGDIVLQSGRACYWRPRAEGHVGHDDTAIRTITPRDLVREPWIPENAILDGFLDEGGIVPGLTAHGGAPEGAMLGVLTGPELLSPQVDRKLLGPEIACVANFEELIGPCEEVCRTVDPAVSDCDSLMSDDVNSARDDVFELGLPRQPREQMVRVAGFVTCGHGSNRLDFHHGVDNAGDGILTRHESESEDGGNYRPTAGLGHACLLGRKHMFLRAEARDSLINAKSRLTSAQHLSYSEEGPPSRGRIRLPVANSLKPL